MKNASGPTKRAPWGVRRGKGGKGRIDLGGQADRRGVEYLGLQPDGGGGNGFLHCPQCELGGAKHRTEFHEHGNTNGLGAANFMQEPALGHHLSDKKIDAGRVTADQAEAGDKTKPDRVFDRRRRRLGS